MKAEIITSSMQCGDPTLQTLGTMGLVLLLIIFGFCLCRRISMCKQYEKRLDLQRRQIVRLKYGKNSPDGFKSMNRGVRE